MFLNKSEYPTKDIGYDGKWEMGSPVKQGNDKLWERQACGHAVLRHTGGFKFVLIIDILKYMNRRNASISLLQVKLLSAGLLRNGILSAVLFFAVFPLTVGPALAQKVDCLECHKELAEGKIVHAAVQMGCESCHTGVDASVIPHKFSGAKKGLSAEVPNLCFQCHSKNEFTKKIVHAPVAGGICLNCHRPHSGPYGVLLIKEGNQLCLQCHPTITMKPHVVTSAVPHGHELSGREDPKREGKPFGCASCHVPHSSAWGKLYRYEAEGPSGLCKHCHEFMQ